VKSKPATKPPLLRLGVQTQLRQIQEALRSSRPLSPRHRRILYLLTGDLLAARDARPRFVEDGRLLRTAGTGARNWFLALEVGFRMREEPGLDQWRYFALVSAPFPKAAKISASTVERAWGNFSKKVQDHFARIADDGPLLAADRRSVRIALAVFAKKSKAS
jgi:hypothetical protein